MANLGGPCLVLTGNVKWVERKVWPGVVEEQKERMGEDKVKAITTSWLVLVVADLQIESEKLLAGVVSSILKYQKPICKFFYWLL